MTDGARRRIGERLAYLAKIRLALDAEYTAADRAFCIRRMEASGYVARAIGVPLSGLLAADVTLVARGMGWTPVRPMNRRLYAGVKRRSLTEVEALAASRELRRDPRES